MAHGPLPKTANYTKLVIQGAFVEGELMPSNAPRIEHLDADTPLLVRFDFGRDEQQRDVLCIRITGKVQSQCQRCLEMAAIELDVNSKLILVGHEQSASDLPEDVDYWVAEDEVLQLAELVEEEVLLALPTVVYHEQCEMYGGGASADDSASESNDGAGAKNQEKENPFAVLQQLKAGKAPDSEAD